MWTHLFTPSLVMLVLLDKATAQIQIPPSNGSYSILYSTAKLTDKTRIDPFDPNHGNRSIMVSLSYPIPKDACTQHCSIPYMPASTASFFDQLFGMPNGTASSFLLETCCETNQDYTPNPQETPFVIFSPGLQSSRLAHNAQIQTLAASGYAVLSIDHPWDAAVLEFPNEPPIVGTLINDIADNSTGTPILNWDVLASGVQIRAADVEFALDEFNKLSTVQLLLPDATSSFNTTRTAIFGHSYGGATSMLSLTQDSRLIGALNMDGALYGMNDSRPTSSPAVFLGTSSHNHTSTDEVTWSDVWSRLNGYKREFSLQKAAHSFYMDFPLLFELAGFVPVPAVAAQFGELGVERGKYGFGVVMELVEAFVDFVFWGKESVLLEDPESVFPEVLKVED
ncbi:unnamed protein product [Periconia digitata]|uniref:1-alkyl-2-acetylglycerophosphocholine esterase n=1 Tax=Periconia digitata TaxID=1303443 RepID=A0A9W4XGX6_9PLEO|nr:unnamed protein product [Periconia digitata]